MRVKLWGARGSLATPGPNTARYGGNTSCVEVQGADGTVLVLDAGTGIRPLGASLAKSLRRVDVLLSHLHMDHIQGLGFFAALYNPSLEVHIWGPASMTLSLRARLMRYLSPPLFPVHLRDLPCRLTLHEVPAGDFEVGEFRVSPARVCHPGPTVGYRIGTARSVIAYLPDHEPALGTTVFPSMPQWTSGYDLAAGVDLLVHDSQYSDDEYVRCAGWGHGTFRHAIQFAKLARVKALVPFHHDPAHGDDDIDRLIEEAVADLAPDFPVMPGKEGAVFEVPS
ncbi:MAG: MBL fold metallo-hydrolase [Candidatus Binatia bacterium]